MEVTGPLVNGTRLAGWYFRPFIQGGYHVKESKILEIG